jgi:hypothetical protein
MMNRDDPDTWTEADWNAYDNALDRLCSFKADQFARDLDRLGWKIVLQEPGEDPHGRPIVWPMNGSKGPCPWWAHDGFNAPPPLRLIKGGKPDEPR